MKRKTRKMLRQAFKISGASRVLGIYTVFFVLAAVLLRFAEPDISSFGDAPCMLNEYV